MTHEDKLVGLLGSFNGGGARAPCHACWWQWFFLLQGIIRRCLARRHRRQPPWGAYVACEAHRPEIADKREAALVAATTGECTGVRSSGGGAAQLLDDGSGLRLHGLHARTYVREIYVGMGNWNCMPAGRSNLNCRISRSSFALFFSF